MMKKSGQWGLFGPLHKLAELSQTLNGYLKHKKEKESFVKKDVPSPKENTADTQFIVQNGQSETVNLPEESTVEPQNVDQNPDFLYELSSLNDELTTIAREIENDLQYFESRQMEDNYKQLEHYQNLDHFQHVLTECEERYFALEDQNIAYLSRASLSKVKELLRSANVNLDKLYLKLSEQKSKIESKEENESPSLIDDLKSLNACINKDIQSIERRDAISNHVQLARYLVIFKDYNRRYSDINESNRSKLYAAEQKFCKEYLGELLLISLKEFRQKIMEDIQSTGKNNQESNLSQIDNYSLTLNNYKEQYFDIYKPAPQKNREPDASEALLKFFKKYKQRVKTPPMQGCADRSEFTASETLKLIKEIENTLYKSNAPEKLLEPNENGPRHSTQGRYGS